MSDIFAQPPKIKIFLRYSSTTQTLINNLNNPFKVEICNASGTSNMLVIHSNACAVSEICSIIFGVSSKVAELADPAEHFDRISELVSGSALKFLYEKN